MSYFRIEDLIFSLKVSPETVSWGHLTSLSSLSSDGFWLQLLIDDKSFLFHAWFMFTVSLRFLSGLRGLYWKLRQKDFTCGENKIGQMREGRMFKQFSPCCRELTVKTAATIPQIVPAKTSHQWWRRSVIRVRQHRTAHVINKHCSQGTTKYLFRGIRNWRNDWRIRKYICTRLSHKTAVLRVIAQYLKLLVLLQINFDSHDSLHAAG